MPYLDNSHGTHGKRILKTYTTMQQKTIWKAVLIIGILIGLISCKKTIDKNQYEEFYYMNNSTYDLSINVYNKLDAEFTVNTYTIHVNDELSQETELMSGSKTGIIALCDSVTVVFGNERISHFVPSSVSPFSILDFNNYFFVKKGSNRSSYTYTFTEEDYHNAEEP